MARKQLFSSPVIRKIEIINSKKQMKILWHGSHIVGGLRLTHELGFRLKQSVLKWQEFTAFGFLRTDKMFTLSREWLKQLKIYGFIVLSEGNGSYTTMVVNVERIIHVE